MTDQTEETFLVRCYQPEGRTVTSHMKSAVHSLKQHQFELVWLSQEECLNVKIKKSKCVYVFDKFEGDAFDHTRKLGYRIYGPLCILKSLTAGTQLPKAVEPVFNAAMTDIVACCTGMVRENRGPIQQKVATMGGTLSGDYSQAVTHLIAGEVGSKKYIVAATLGKKIMSPEWVLKVWEKSQLSLVHANDEEFEEYKCPVLKGLILTISGTHSVDRARIIEMIQEEGGIYSGEMKQNKCTHLIINECKGQKYEFAKKWKLKIVTLQWLYDCIEKGYCLCAESYEPGKDSGKTRNTSTPTRESIGGRMSLGDVSAISMTTINDTAMTSANMSTLLQDQNSLDRLDIALYNKAQGFLDGFQIYVIGFSGPPLEKIRKIINMGGGTRFNNLNASVSHVIVPSEAASLIQQIKDSEFRPHVVKVEWIITCLKEDTNVAEDDFLLLDSSAGMTVTPRKKRSAKPSGDRSANNDTVIEMNPNNSRAVHDDQENMQDLMSQYMPVDQGETVDESALLRAAEQVNQQEGQAAQVPPEDDDDTQDPNSADVTEDASEHIFRKKVFVILGFPASDEGMLVSCIREMGGTLVPPTSRRIPDYAVVPLLGTEVKMTVGEVVTNAWLEICSVEGCVPPTDANEMYKPIPNIPGAEPLKGCVLSISGYGGTERDALTHIAELLGAKVQESFMRKKTRDQAACTQLVVNAPEGSKYKAAVKWGIPPVTKHWLFESAKLGRRVPEENFDVLREDSHKSVPNIAQTNGKQSVCVEKDNLTETIPANKSVSNRSNTTRVNSTSNTTTDIEKNDTMQADDVKEESTDRTVAVTNNADDIETFDPTDLNRSDKENDATQIENQNKTANESSMKTPVNNRVKTLINSYVETANIHPLKAVTPQGVDSPWKFLKKGSIYKPSFDMQACMDAYKTPEVDTKGKSRRRKSSLPVDEMMSLHVNKALKKRGVQVREESVQVKEEVVNTTEEGADETKADITKTIAESDWCGVSISQMPKNQTRTGTRNKGSTPRRSTRLKKEGMAAQTMQPPSPIKQEAEEVHDVPESLEVKEELTKQLGNFMAATKVQQAKRGSRRLNSSDGHLSDSLSKNRSSSKQRNRMKDEDTNSSPAAKKKGKAETTNNISKPGQPEIPIEASQSVRVTWDDPTDRKEQEELAEELNQGSETQSQDANNCITNQVHIQDVEEDLSNITLERPKSPEAPSLTMPLPKRSVTIEPPQPVELIEDINCEENMDEAKIPPVFQLSSLTQQERADYGALIEELGGKVSEAKYYDEACTHLIVGVVSRQEKYLSCLAAGKWVLHKSYLEECRKHSSFVEEEQHEWGGEATAAILAKSNNESTVKLAKAAHRWRTNIQSSNGAITGAFNSWKVILVTGESRIEGFKRMLEAGGAEVVAIRPPFTNLSSVTHAFMDLHKVDYQVNVEDFIKARIHCLRPDYLVAYLSENPSPLMSSYIIPEAKAQMNSSKIGNKKRKSSGSESSIEKRSRQT